MAEAKESPYTNKNVNEWLKITQEIVSTHPLSIDEILDNSLSAWNGVWSTQIGKDKARIPLSDVNPPATVIGYFFEKLLAKELSTKHPGIWRGEDGGNEKDLHYIPDPPLSIEVKASGQLGLKIYGNRSYGQKVENEDLAKKDKSGYYITVNFYKDKLTLIRFGWIDSSDWKPQKSPTGQMAGLTDDVYQYKLLAIPGDYTLEAPVQLLPGAGPGKAKKLADLNINTIRQLLDFGGPLTKDLTKIKSAATEYANEFGSS